MDNTYQVRTGSHAPLGATWDGKGVNFAIYSETATSVQLCFVDSQGREERIDVRDRTEYIWHVYVEGAQPGQRYGYRISGPWKPEAGLRFNPNNLLLDPYARALDGVEDWKKGVFSYDIQHSERDLVRAPNDQRGAPLGIVVDPSFDWGDDAPPNVPFRKSVIYEAHVKGLTMRHPDVPAELRGSYAAIGSEPIIRHLRELGITAIELLPIHGFVDDQFLLDQGLRNYWGYNSIAFFAPDVRYRTGGTPGSEVRQFKEMVKRLHAAGIEVILDVVYNHTAEGNNLGPTFSFRGIDNPTYYRLVGDNPRFYFDYTGTGNSLNVRHPQTLRLIMDSLRYWVSEMHVDGFRFDLASTLARSLHDVDKLSSFFSVINQDPILANVKLIAEPWDVGEGGYQVGGFPVRWAEWNGKYRDSIRDFWRAVGSRAAEIGYRLTGSADLYEGGGRKPYSSVNFIVAHDGFTMRDLVSYNGKHNEANGEGNRDGADNNGSWNCGAEGETSDPGIKDLRARQQRNLLTTLLLSQGTPMICGGDEIGRTQRGNNNAYCQDNELSWHDWELDEPRKALLAFVKKLLRIRREHPVLQLDAYVHGRQIRGLGVSDLVWFRHDGRPMSDQDWNNPGTASLGMFLAGSDVGGTDEQGRPLMGDDLCLVMNASNTDLDFTVPTFVERGRSTPWELLVDTWADDVQEEVPPDGKTSLRARSSKVFTRRALGAAGLAGAYGAATSTYRLQLNGGFRFDQAAEIVGYLEELGVGAVYASPYLRAEKGSTHGYNVIDHRELNPELGSREVFDQWTQAIKDRGMKHILDFVPNHVGVGAGQNAWWHDVLENGPSSTYADYFDIDWEPPSKGLYGKVLLPVLGAQFGEELESGRLSFVRDGGSFWVAYDPTRFPASLRSTRLILDAAAAASPLSADDPGHQELESIASALRNLPLPMATEPEERPARARERDVSKRRLAKLFAESAEVAALIDRVLVDLNRSPGRLEELLHEQNYRLAFWRVATEEINYRRFFDVNELAAIRMEDPRVFEATHSLVLDLLAEGRVTGLRLDHTDGLYDPQAYFEALQTAARAALLRGGHSVEPGRPLYVVAEKILERGEELPRAWALAGTSGYDFLSAINGIWVDGSAQAAMSKIYTEFTGDSTSFERLAYEAKLDILRSTLASEIQTLARSLKRIADTRRHARDFTLASLLRAVEETIAAFPVYRTYVRPDGSRQPHDEKHVRRAIAAAKRKTPTVEASVFEFLHSLLILKDHAPDAVRFAMRFQQLTGPVMAKGVEDTAVYRFHQLVSNNEVGCDPGHFASPVSQIHEHNEATLSRWPLAMNATTTHDTKRSEDVRARIAALSEDPEAWREHVLRLQSHADAYTRKVDEEEKAPSGSDAYLFYQVAFGAFPFDGLQGPEQREEFTTRLTNYMLKAVREAKVRTSWNTPNAAYDEAVQAFVRGCLFDDAFVKELELLTARFAPSGAANSLAQLAFRLASPGIPDIYRGCELWDLSLVDPDNRRPVDFAARRAHLEALVANGAPNEQLATQLVASYPDGRIKLHVTRVALRLRREHPALFLEGSYKALTGPSENVVAFERALGQERLVVVVPRLSLKRTKGSMPFPLGKVWGDEALSVSSAGPLVNAFTGESLSGGSLRLAEVFRTFPVAWLCSWK